MDKLIGQKPKITLKDTTAVVCPCGGKIFTEGRFIRTISRILTGEAEDSIMPIPIIYCVRCFAPLDAMTPQELK